MISEVESKSFGVFPTSATRLRRVSEVFLKYSEDDRGVIKLTVPNCNFVEYTINKKNRTTFSYNS